MGIFNKEPKEFVYSNLKFTDRLPIGTIITLKNISNIEKFNSIVVSNYLEGFNENLRTGKFIIVGYAKESFERSNEEKNKFIQVDYYCAAYPVGEMPDGVFSIRESDIDEVIFRGYDNDERYYFLKEMENMIEGSDNNG